MALEFPQRAGIIGIVIAGSFSFIFVVAILFYTAFGGAYRLDISDNNLFLSLMVAELVHAIGVMFNIKWAADGIVTEGSFCKAQTVVKQIGNLGMSFSSLAITVYTFCVLVYLSPKRASQLDGYTWAIVLGIWIAVELVVGISSALRVNDPSYYSDTGCYIGSSYLASRVGTDYLWLWLNGLAMVIFYPIMAIAIWRLNPPEFKAMARKLMCLTRWLSFTGHHVPHEAILAANALRAASGFVNFLVFAITRPAMVFRN